MRLRRRAAAITLVLALIGAALTSMAPARAVGTFVDDDGNVHEAVIERIAAVGITRGCNPPINDRYCPSQSVTRGQMAAFLVRAFGLDNAADISFEDTGGHVFEEDIARLATAGITRGCNPPANTRFCPDVPVTRGQMAAFLVRALGLVDISDNQFTDTAGSVFEADISRLAAAGITRGCNPPSSTSFCPNQLVLRDQMATFLSRAYDIHVTGTTTSVAPTTSPDTIPHPTSPTETTSPSTSTTRPTVAPPPRGWATLEPMNDVLTDSSASTLGGFLYLAAGKRSPEQKVRDFLRYDPGADAWSHLTAIPGVGREDASLVTAGKHLYIFGGASASPFVGEVKTTASYSPAAGAWSDGAVENLPAGRSGMAAVLYNGDIWLIGGLGPEGSSLDSVLIYDISSDTYLDGPDLPSPRDHAGVAVVDGHIYVFGGRNRQGGKTLGEARTVLRLTSPTSEWAVFGNQMPAARRSFVVGVTDGKVQLFGGESETDPTIATVDEFDPVTGTWKSPHDPLPTPRHGAAGSTIGGSTYVVGGSLAAGADNLTDVNERFTR